jgi:hypothetical protein
MTATRKEKLKSLMRDRRTLDSGLKLRQIIYEVFPDKVEEYTNTTKEDEAKFQQRKEQMLKEKENKRRRDHYLVNHYCKFNTFADYQLEDLVFEKRQQTQQIIKNLRKDDEFRWLLPMPYIENGKIKEYRYVNIKGTDTELLDLALGYREKQKQRTLAGLENAIKRLDNTIKTYEFFAQKEGKPFEQVVDMALEHADDRVYRNLVKENVTKKSIVEVVKQLKAAQQITNDYKVNIEGIQLIVHVFLI